MTSKQMDPERYQMRDIKRRLTACERYNAKLEAKLTRLAAQIQRKLDAHQNMIDELYNGPL